MKRFACLLLAAAALTAAACAAASAQRKQQQQGQSPARPALAGDATLAETLAWLDAELRQYGKVTVHAPLYEPGYRIKYQFLGLEGQGCSATYRLGYTALGAPDVYSPGAMPFAPRPGGASAAVEEGTIYLSALDPSLVAGEPLRWGKGGRVNFYAVGGQTAVRKRSRGGARSYELDRGALYLSDKGRVGAVADALRRAVELCRK